MDSEDVFGLEGTDLQPVRSYRIASADALTPEAFKKIYESNI
jgi:hypothetical protein